VASHFYLSEKDYSFTMGLTVGKHLRNLSGPILITGHTGFKGTWLTLLLEQLEVPVIGLSLPPEEESLFDRAKRTGVIPEEFIDIRDPSAVSKFLSVFQPSAVIHMAAQPLVFESYKNPRETFETNVMGTVNLLDASFQTNSIEAIVVVTTDKVYRNDNSGQVFVEVDPLEGKDPYSASKVGTESVVAAWRQIAKVSGGPKVVSVRAGNVIGGGDWAKNRLIPDLIRGITSGVPIQIRNPQSTRPWQHVLDPLKGYLMALEEILLGGDFEGLNFGPITKSLSVREIVEQCQNYWPFPFEADYGRDMVKSQLEAIELHLDSTLARSALKWNPTWDQSESIKSTFEWWNKVLNSSISPTQACMSDIEFLLQANNDGLP